MCLRRGEAITLNQLYIHIFRHLKLEIALAIPASNDEKYNSPRGYLFIHINPLSAGGAYFHFQIC